MAYVKRLTTASMDRPKAEGFSFSKLSARRKKRILIMGVLNITPDSFFDGGKYFGRDKAVARGREIALEGADILDIGGESTRPGSNSVSLEEERERVIPVIEELAKKLTIPISIDTTRAEIAGEALSAGARIINDVSAFNYSLEMAEVALRFGAGVILMHMQGTPREMQVNPHYREVVAEIKSFLAAAIARAEAIGIAGEAIAIDPGIGFGKTLSHNLEILKRLEEFKSLGKKILIGLSRKSFIGQILNLPPEERLAGSMAASIWAVLHGAEIVRVHDVLAMERARAIIEAIEK